MRMRAVLLACCALSASWVDAQTYTLLMSSPSALVVSPHLLKSILYDPQKDLAPVVWIAAVPALMAVHPSTGEHIWKSAPRADQDGNRGGG